VPTSLIRPSSSTRLVITQSPSTGTSASDTPCRAFSSDRPPVSRLVSTVDTSAMSASRAAVRRARSSAARRSVMSRKETDRPSGVGHDRTSNQALSGSGYQASNTCWVPVSTLARYRASKSLPTAAGNSSQIVPPMASSRVIASTRSASALR
jgi:hypothetical protein